MSPAWMAQLRAGRFAEYRLADALVTDPVTPARLLAAGNAAALPRVRIAAVQPIDETKEATA